MPKPAITYPEMIEALIHGLEIGRLTAGRRTNGELTFAPVGREPANWQPVDAAQAIAELRMGTVAQHPICLN
ncbi:MAG: hypothetical protein KDD78_16985 [Caldilineaceae bacterium]|nr:hypothetical protein [Caldilineaceae bacterium]